MIRVYIPPFHNNFYPEERRGPGSKGGGMFEDYLSEPGFTGFL